MGPRSNVKVIRSMQEDSHLRIKSYSTHLFNSRNVEEDSDHLRRESNGDPPHLTPDAKGHRYMQVYHHYPWIYSRYPLNYVAAIKYFIK